MTKETPPDTDAKAKPKSRLKRNMLIGGVVIATAGGGIGAGMYAAGAMPGVASAAPEDPNRPKLVRREVDAEDAPPAEGEATELKVGTVSVKSDDAPIDRKAFEATYFPIEQNFTANLADGSGFVQVGLSLATYYDGKVIKNLTRQAVPIRSAILLVLSDQDANVISTPEGKKLLQKQLTAAINQVLRTHEGFGGIDNVYFTTLVIQ